MSKRTPWYATGLRFTCQRCGNCCGGAPGYVWISEAEIVAMAETLGVSEADFRQRYTRIVHRRGVSLAEQPNYDCVFFEPGRGCRVYAVRPRQCRTWPFWRVNLINRGSWEFAGESCPGMGAGQDYDRDRIERISDDDGLP